MLAAVEAGCAVVEYTPAEVKRAVVGYGRAEKRQVQQMVKLLLGLDRGAVAARRRRRAGRGASATCTRRRSAAAARAAPAPTPRRADRPRGRRARLPRSWRQYRPPAHG